MELSNIPQFIKTSAQAASLAIGFVCLPAHAGVIYSNDFNSSDALNDFYVGELGVANVELSDGQVAISPGDNYLNRGFISLDMRSFSADYSSVLNENDLITWAFNISNENGLFNNLFYVEIQSESDPSAPDGFGYSLMGGGFVQDRMIFSESASALSPYGPVFNPLVDVDSVNGLSPLPEKGAFKITYDSNDNIWQVFFESGPEYIDPLSIDTLVGIANSDQFVNDDLPYLIFGSHTSGTAYLDNLTVVADSFSVSDVPEPATAWLMGLGVLAAFRRSRLFS